MFAGSRGASERWSLWTTAALMLLLSVAGSVAAIRLEPGPSSIARWVAAGFVLFGMTGVLLVRPPGPDRWHRFGTMVLIGCLAVSAYSIGKAEIWPQRGVLDPERIESRALSVDVRGEPVASQLYRIDIHAPPDRNMGGSRLRLLEDGEALGPQGTPTSEIAQWGFGAFRHTRGTLSFSSSDNSDPRMNGRTYEYLRYPAVPGPILIILLAGLAVASIRWLRTEGAHRRSAIAASTIAAVSLIALNAFHIDEAPLNIKDARQNLEMAQAIATMPEARELGWLLTQRREPLPNIMLAVQMRLDPRLTDIIQGSSVQAPEFQVALKQNTLLYVGLLYAFAFLAIRRIIPSSRPSLAAFTLFAGLTHFLFLQFPEYINRNYTEVHAAAFLVMSGFFLLRYSETRAKRDGLFAIGGLLALTFTKGLFIIVLGFTVIALVGDLASRQVRRHPTSRASRVVLVVAAGAVVVTASGVGALGIWGAQLSAAPANPETAQVIGGYAMSSALPGRVMIPVGRSFWNVRDGQTLQQRFIRNLPPLVRPERYERGYEVGSERLPLPPSWGEPQFSSGRRAQVAAVAVVTYNHLRDPVATLATALSVASLLTVAPRSVDLTLDQRDILRLIVAASFVGMMLCLVRRRDSTVWFYLPTLLGMLSYGFLAHGRYRYWAPFLPTAFIATAVGLVLIGVALDRRARAGRLQRRRPGQRFSETSVHMGVDG